LPRGGEFMSIDFDVLETMAANGASAVQIVKEIREMYAADRNSERRVRDQLHIFAAQAIRKGDAR
jgi:hypothetical protein